MVGCELVISGSDTPTLLDPVEEPLDEVARAVKARTKADRVLAIAFRRNVGGFRPGHTAGVCRPLIYSSLRVQFSMHLHGGDKNERTRIHEGKRKAVGKTLSHEGRRGAAIGNNSATQFVQW